MKISVITTTYNRKILLQEAMESIERSICIPLPIEFEHIVYDDASTDGTEKLFEGDRWKKVIYIRGVVNKGQSFGKNRAIEKATGEYIFLLDSDDVVVSRTLYNFAKLASEKTTTAWFTSDFLRTNNALAYEIGEDYYGWDFATIEAMLQSIFRGEHFLQSNVFFRKDLFHASGGFDESMNMGEDLDLYIRFLVQGGALPYHASHISHLHRNHENNVSSGITQEKHMEQVKFLRQKYVDELSRLGVRV